MDELVLTRVLEECLEAMERGETDLDALASRYPAARDEIRPLLEIATLLRQRRALSPAPADVLRELEGRLGRPPLGG